MSDFTVGLEDKVEESCVNQFRFLLIDIEKTVSKKLYLRILSAIVSEASMRLEYDGKTT